MSYKINYGNVDENGTRVPTIFNEVYIANKRNSANISHIFTYKTTGGTFSTNKILETPPYDIIAASADNNDITYFGIATNAPNSGPFSNLIFDIGDVARYSGGTTGMTWQYYSGSWTNLTTTLVDRTNLGNGSGAQVFTNPGAGGVFWSQSAYSNWVPTTINSVTAYWVRVVCNISAGSISVATQQNKHVYTCTWPYVEIQADEIGGDIDALLNINIHAQSGDNSVSTLFPSRVIAGARHVRRGSRFTPVINFAQEQNPDGITVATSGAATFTADLAAPAGEHIRMTSLSLQERATVTMDSGIASHYRGRFRAFVRVDTDAVGAPADLELQIKYVVGSGGGTIENESTIITLQVSPTEHMLADLGEVNIGQGSLPIDQIEFQIFGGAASNWDLIDLWLIPSDEWSMDVRDRAFKAVSGIYGERILSIDGISFPKEDSWAVKEAGSVLSEYEHIADHPRVVPRERIRFYFLCTQLPDLVSNIRGRAWIANSVTMSKVQRYLSYRGKN